MIHARKDYQRLQDPAGLIPEDEPVFLIRAQDVVGPRTVQLWADCAEGAGADARIVAHARKHAEAMSAYQTSHCCKIPDMPEENSDGKDVA